MSENLSVDEIIKRAESIKEKAEEQIHEAEKSLNEKTRVIPENIVVDEKAVAEKIARAVEDEPDVKEYIPVKRAPAQRVDEKTSVVKLNKSEETKVFSDKEATGEAVLVSGATKKNSGDLQEIPTLVAKDKLIDGFTNEQPEENEGEQIRFEGFDDKIESVPTIDEAQAERELEKRRKEKVGKFRLFGPDETDLELGENSVVESDFESVDEKTAFIESLVLKKNSISIKLIITAVLGAPLVFMEMFKDSAYFPNFLSSHTAFFVFAIVLYSALIAVNYNVFTHGFNIKKSFNFDFAVSLVNVLIFLHTAVLLVLSSVWIDNGVLLAGAGAFSLFMSQLGKQRMMTRIIDNIEFITDGGEKYTVENIANAVDAEIISRGLVEAEEPLLKMSVKTDFPSNFLEISCKNEPADKIAVALLWINTLLSAALFIAVGLLDNFNTAFNCAVCSMAISLPVSALFVTNNMLCDISSQLLPFSSRVCGFEGASMADNADAVVMEASDLFDKKSCDLYGIKTFSGAKVDDAIIYAAAVMVQTKSPLARCFDDVIIGKQSILPEVDGVTYEEKLGTSAWVYKRKVLVGTRELLRAHGINVPKESFENKFTIKGRKALYLAISGEIIAMFIVSYSPDPDLRKELKKLEKSGKTIIVKSSDPYINEDSLCEMFSLPKGFIRVMNYSSARVFDKYSALNVEKSPAYVVHDGSALGFVSAMRAAGIAVSSKTIIKFLAFFGSLLGVAVTMLLSLLGAYSQLSTIGIIGFQFIWGLFMVIITRLRGVGL